MVQPNKECQYAGYHYLGKLHPELVSLNEPGKEVSAGLVLCTGAHKRSLGKRLAQGKYYTLVLTRGAWKRR